MSPAALRKLMGAASLRGRRQDPTVDLEAVHQKVQALRLQLRRRSRE